jgi:hypothetical protein
MNTIWLKIAGVAVVLVVVLIVGSRFMSNKPASTPQTQAQETEKPKTVYDEFERDKQFLKEPEAVNEPAATQEPAAEPQTAQQAPVQEPTPEPAQPTVQASPYVMPSSITQKTELYFKPLSETDDLAAQELMPYATTGRSIGRLPFMHPNLMVKACRQAEERWPDSWYAFRAKQLLEEISERYGATYNITEQELDISKFLKPRPGTEARWVEPVQR